MKTALSKKEIRNNLETVLIAEIEKMEGTESSGKVKKAVRKLSKGIAVRVRTDMKKLQRKEKKGRDRNKGSKFNGFLIEEEKTEPSHI